MGSDWRDLLLHSWSRRGPVAMLLWPFAAFTGMLVAGRKWLYRWGFLRTRHVTVPVIVVGSVLAGGTGKTPVVIAMVQHLRQRGLRPGVVSRGYGRKSTACIEVLPASTVIDVGDEPRLIHKLTGVPVFVAAERFLAAKALLAKHPDTNVVVCDDGQQHYGIHRDIEVCVFDHRGTGNGWLLPAGPLREPWPRPCDLVLAPRADAAASTYAVQRALGDVGATARGLAVRLDQLAVTARRETGPIWAVAAIAQPQQFFFMLGSRGIALAGTIRLADHAPIVLADLAPATGCTLLCTEKDADKVWPIRPDAIAVPLQLSIDPQFWTAFDRLLAERRATKLSSSDGHPTD